MHTLFLAMITLLNIASATQQSCAACNKPGAKLRCGRCKRAYYCSKECQRDHWRGGHKRECGKNSPRGDSRRFSMEALASAIACDEDGRTAKPAAPAQDPMFKIMQQLEDYRAGEGSESWAPNNDPDAWPPAMDRVGTYKAGTAVEVVIQRVNGDPLTLTVPRELPRSSHDTALFSRDGGNNPMTIAMTVGVLKTLISRETGVPRHLIQLYSEDNPAGELQNDAPLDAAAAPPPAADAAVKPATDTEPKADAPTKLAAPSGAGAGAASADTGALHLTMLRRAPRPLGDVVHELMALRDKGVLTDERAKSQAWRLGEEIFKDHGGLDGMRRVHTKLVKWRYSLPSNKEFASELNYAWTGVGGRQGWIG